MGPLPSDDGVPGCLLLPTQRWELVALTLSRMAAGPHGEVLGKDLWQEGSLGRLPLWDQGGCSEWCDLRGVSTQNWWWLGGPKSSKPWWRQACVDMSVMTVWRKKEGFLLAFSLVHTLKRQCGWKRIFLGFLIPPLEQAVRAVSAPRNFFCYWKLFSLFAA